MIKYSRPIAKLGNQSDLKRGEASEQSDLSVIKSFGVTIEWSVVFWIVINSIINVGLVVYCTSSVSNYVNKGS